MMKKHILLLLSFALLALIANLFPWGAREESAENPSEAGAAFEYWSAARMFPDGSFHTEKYAAAFDAMQLSADLRDERNQFWQDLGPKNIGGRTLCLAVNPVDTNILWLGSASGGIWKSVTAGRGPAAWQRVETGFPLLGVSSIAIDPSNTNIMYAGTGEVYNLENTIPNVAIRTTRGTYGIGILKSTDGGQSWQKSLDWSYGQLRAVQDIKINPLRPATLLAATTEGLLRSYDGGTSWQTVLDVKMAVDIEINPVDTNILFVTCGSLDDDNFSGIYRSKNGGASFEKLTNGLPVAYGGKTLLGISPSQPSVLYASIADSEKQIGLFKTTNNGDTWLQVNSTDVAKHQGWYSHDVAVHPANPDTLMWVGFDSWKSANGGTTVKQKSYWNLWTFGYVPAGGPEGPAKYVHADIHRVYYAPGDNRKVYMVTDGGLFVSYDGGESFQGRNGGYQTQQFYANLGISLNNNKFVGGMQDNATAVFTGDPSWTRVLGADGLCAAIRPLDDQIMYGSIQYLAMQKSTDGGANWYDIGGEINENACFNGPFDIWRDNPDIMYAGAQSLWRSNDAGESWFSVSNGYVDNGNSILAMALHPMYNDVVLFSTAPTATDQARVFLYSNVTNVWGPFTGLPNRYCMDMAWDPSDADVAYAVFAGFNTAHVWKTEDLCQSWTPIDNGLPDLPVNCILIDPWNTNILYVGTDLGVWASVNGGQSWAPYSADAPQSMLVMDLGISADRKLLVATHGLGLWQTDLLEGSSVQEPGAGLQIQSLSPNPLESRAELRFALKERQNLQCSIFDLSGKRLWMNDPKGFQPGSHSIYLPFDGLPAGIYVVALSGEKGRATRKVVKRQ